MLGFQGISFSPNVLKFRGVYIQCLIYREVVAYSVVWSGHRDDSLHKVLLQNFEIQYLVHRDRSGRLK
jgi:hypothetical protein